MDQFVEKGWKRKASDANENNSKRGISHRERDHDDDDDDNAQQQPTLH